jgi:hypothetical protein
VELAVQIAGYLIPLTKSDTHNLEWVWCTAHTSPADTRYSRKEQERAEILRMILRSSCEDPLEGTSPQFWMHLSYENHPVSQVLRQQDYWMIDLEAHSDFRYPNTYIENDRQMLRDPLGVQVAKALRQGQYYLPFPAHCGQIYDFYRFKNPSIGNLLEVYSVSERPDVRECCKNRMIILFRSGLNPGQCA